ncbi:superoxide dismutase family protein [Cesiribacter sp. SM1]|uniref:superoxide dismutase family protein n=1 Tax=Cesiribacter sp. SM1 TaxID=2861196 RepID=UPI001CD67C7A|nr:superoxide dismutase family protein [Cesiribacter sp. SM1]
MKTAFSVLFAGILLLVGCKKEEQPAPKAIEAHAPIYSLSGSSTTPAKLGDAYFTQQDGVVTLELEVAGLAAGGSHAIHLHEGSCENPGMHWNGGSSDSYCQVPNLDGNWGRPYLGDVGNIEIEEDGTGTLTLRTNLWAIGDGSPLDITGKMIMLHEQPEDFDLECDPNHQNHPHNNPKIACGAIGSSH